MTGRASRGYREEDGVEDSSATETFAAVRLEVDTWRWKGVPFYLRTGKRLAADHSEIALQFRDPPTRLFRDTPLARSEPNWLVFQLRPCESIGLIAQARNPGLDFASRPVNLHADYAAAGEQEHSAYEQLLLDVIEGDHTPFLRFDEVEWAWRVMTPILDAWSAGRPSLYPAGSDGPAEQSRLLDSGHQWRPLTRPTTGTRGGQSRSQRHEEPSR